MSYFYSEYIEIDTLIQGLEELDLKESHRKDLAQLLDSTIHHTVLDLILTKLSDEDKKLFIEKLNENPKDPELMKFLKMRVDTIEDDIKSAVKELKEELHEDIKEAKRR